MKTRYLIVIVIAGIIIAVMSAIYFYGRLGKGDASPPFALKDASGVQVSLEGLRGKTVFLHFWATWCGTCLSEIPVIEKIHAEFKDRNVAFVTVLVDDDGSMLGAVKNRTNFSYPVFPDPDGLVADSYRVWGVPETFIIDRNGIILRRSSSAVRYDEMNEYLDHLLTQ